MRFLITVMSLFISYAHADSIACRDILMLANVQQVGNLPDAIFVPVYQQTGHSITVEPSQKNADQYVGHIQLTTGGAIQDISDVKIGTMGAYDNGELSAMAMIMLPHLDYTKVAKVLYADIGDAEGNPPTTDASTIFVLLASDGSVLNRLVKVPKGYGLCAADY